MTDEKKAELKRLLSRKMIAKASYIATDAPDDFGAYADACEAYWTACTDYVTDLITQDV